MITTYDELKAAVTSWLQRSDLSGEAANFIQLAESEFNRSLRTTEMEARARAYADDEYLSLPDDFLAVREIHIEGTPDRLIENVTPQQLSQKIAENNTGTEPRFFSIVDGQFKFFPVPSEILLIEIIYIQKIPALSASNPTNWLLDNHPDLYLFCSLGQAEAFLHNDKRIGIWASRCSQIMEAINSSANKARIGAGPLLPKVKDVI